MSLDTSDGSDIYTKEENHILDAANAKFISTPDTNHEFSDYPQLGLFQIRGNYFSVHENTKFSKENQEQSDTYSQCVFLIHSERNRQKNMCELMMKVWLPELPLFVDLLLKFAKGVAMEEDAWQTESFSLEWSHDSCTIGSSASGQTPQFITNDLLLLFLIQVCDVALLHPHLVSFLDCNFLEIKNKVQALLESITPDQS